MTGKSRNLGGVRGVSKELFPTARTVDEGMGTQTPNTPEVVVETQTPNTLDVVDETQTPDESSTPISKRTLHPTSYW